MKEQITYLGFCVLIIKHSDTITAKILEIKKSE